MLFARRALAKPRPDSIRADVVLPRHQTGHASPVDWRDEVLYFLLVDRFSDAGEGIAPAAGSRQSRRRPAASWATARPWRWDRWAESGAEPLAGRDAGRGELQARLSQAPGRHHLVAVPGVQAARPPRRLPRLRRAGLPRRRSALRHARRSGRVGQRRRTPRACASSSTSSSTIPAPNWLYPPDAPGGAWQPHYTHEPLSASARGWATEARRSPPSRAPRTASGRPSCRTPSTTPAPAAAVWAPATSTTRTPSTSAATS